MSLVFAYWLPQESVSVYTEWILTVGLVTSIFEPLILSLSNANSNPTVSIASFESTIAEYTYHEESVFPWDFFVGIRRTLFFLRLFLSKTAQILIDKFLST